MHSRVLALIAVLAAAPVTTACWSTGAGESPDERAAENAVQAAFAIGVQCTRTGSTGDDGATAQAYGCYPPGGDTSSPLFTGCVVSEGADHSASFFSCFSPDFKGACVVRRGDRFSVMAKPRLDGTTPALQCPHHTMYERVAVPKGMVAVNGWVMEGDSCPGQEAAELQSCDPPPLLWVGAHVRLCARGAVWDVAPEDFTLETVDGRSFTGYGDSSGAPFSSRSLHPGHCAGGSIAFGPIGRAVADAYNPPTIVFHQVGMPSVDWTEPPQPEP